MEEHHLLDIGALDADAVGFGRKEYLSALRSEREHGARVSERDGEVHGFVLLRSAPRGTLLGPLVTRDAEADAARGLLRDALANAPQDAIVALVPDREDALTLLETEGFRRVGDLKRMRAGGTRPAPEGRATEWALGGRLTG